MGAAVRDFVRLADVAKQIRRDVIAMLAEAGSGHPGGSLSAADIVTCLLFGDVMRHRPQEPRWAERDRFIMSKGHGIPVWYAALARAGYFPPEQLATLRKFGSFLQGHPDRVMAPFIEASTGSLGQGLSVALGMALAGKLDRAGYRVYCMIGDGESQEGQIWEAAMAAPKFQLDNLCAILDWNKGQIDGPVEEVMSIEPIADKWRAFNWNVISINGHDFEQILDAFDQAAQTKERPTMIVADTIKGKGVSFMEGVIDWHGKAPNADEAAKALAELA